MSQRSPDAELPADDPHADPSIVHLLSRLAILRHRVRRAVDRRRADDVDADDRFRGLYISEEEVQRLLDQPRRSLVDAHADAERDEVHHGVERAADAAVAAGEVLRLRRVTDAFGLTPIDVEMLLIAVAPDLDPGFERLYAYLHDDVSRRRASVGLALELAGAPLAGSERGRLGAGGPLIEGGLVLVEEDERPFLTRSLRVPDRVAGHLLGDDTPHPAVQLLAGPCAGVDCGEAQVIARAIRRGSRLFYVRDPAGGAGLSMAAAGLARVDRPAVVVDLSRLSAGDDIAAVTKGLVLEARLRGGGIVASPIETLTERGADGVRALSEAPCPVFLVGARAWDPLWSRDVPFLVDGPVPRGEERDALWVGALDGAGLAADDVREATTQFRLTPEQVQRAARVGVERAQAGDRPVEADDLRAGARAQNAAGLDRLARRIEPRVQWGDLVLPTTVVTQLRELVARVRRRDQVLDEWGMGNRSSKGRGIKALFAGDSGTGKTISAEVIAHELGLDLYVIDLSTVVDKYVGETEKNLDRIFGEADRVNGVLLFDEADALFGKRSEVKDAQDRYANVEVAYLLQRMELFEGLAVLTTNLRSNLDEAFARRLDVIVDFSMPDEDDRRRLWSVNLSQGVPVADDIDLSFLAKSFKVSGGNIRNIVLAAAFLAADDDRPVGMADLIRGTEREYRKLGHLCVESEFGPWFRVLVRTDGS